MRLSMSSSIRPRSVCSSLVVTNSPPGVPGTARGLTPEILETLFRYK